MPGTFVSEEGVVAATLAAPGYYVTGYGATISQAAPVGHFVAEAGASAPTPAPPGYFVAMEGASAAIAAPFGRYLPGYGATTAIAAAAGYYVPDAGATMALRNPVGTWTPVGATAPRVASPLYEDQTGVAVSPLYSSDPAPGAVIDLGEVSGESWVALQISNASEDVAQPAELTRLSVLAYEAVPSGALVSKALPMALDPGEVSEVGFALYPEVGENNEVVVLLSTDEKAPYGEPTGTVQRYTIRYSYGGAQDYTAFSEASFSTLETAAGLSDFDADLDGDGIPNGFEYVYQSHPRIPSVGTVNALLPVVGPVWDGERNRPAVSFLLPVSSPADVRLSVEGAASMGATDWKEMAAQGVTGEWTGWTDMQIGAPLEGWVRVTLFDARLGSTESRWFYRLKAQLR